jgi:hypothetical protein
LSASAAAGEKIGAINPDYKYWNRWLVQRCDGPHSRPAELLLILLLLGTVYKTESVE